MAEPQPPIHPGSADLEDDPPAPTGGAEDRKAAAALSSLASLNDEASAPKDDVDQKALGDAISRLEVGKVKEGEEKGKKVAGGEKKKIKVDAGDVALLVSLRFSLQCRSSGLRRGSSKRAAKKRIG